MSQYSKLHDFAQAALEQINAPEADGEEGEEEYYDEEAPEGGGEDEKEVEGEGEEEEGEGEAEA